MSNIGQEQTSILRVPMENPFVSSANRLERLKTVQTCPHCLGEIITYWGEDLRTRGKCPECGGRSVTMRGGAIVTLRYALLVYGLKLAILSGAFLIAFWL